MHVALLAYTDERLVDLADTWVKAGLVADFIAVRVPSAVPDGYQWPSRWLSRGDAPPDGDLRELLSEYPDAAVRLVGVRPVILDGQCEAMHLLSEHVRTALSAQEQVSIDLLLPLQPDGRPIITANGQNLWSVPPSPAGWHKVVLSPEDRPDPSAADAGFDDEVTLPGALHVALVMLGVVAGNWDVLPSLPHEAQLDRLRIVRAFSRIVHGQDVLEPKAYAFVNHVLPDASIAMVRSNDYVRLSVHDAEKLIPEINDIMHTLAHGDFRYHRPSSRWYTRSVVPWYRILGWYLSTLWWALFASDGGGERTIDALVSRAIEPSDIGVDIGQAPSSRRGRPPQDWRTIDTQLRRQAEEEIRRAESEDAPQVPETTWNDLVGLSCGLLDGSALPVTDTSGAHPSDHAFRRQGRRLVFPMDAICEDPEAILGASPPTLRQVRATATTQGGDGWESGLLSGSADPLSGRIDPTDETDLSPDPNEDDEAPDESPAPAVAPADGMQPADGGVAGGEGERLVTEALEEEFCLVPDCARDVSEIALQSVTPYTSPFDNSSQEEGGQGRIVQSLSDWQDDVASERARIEAVVLGKVVVPQHVDPLARELTGNAGTAWGRTHGQIYADRLRAALDCAWWKHQATADDLILIERAPLAKSRFRWRVTRTCAAVGAAAAVQLLKPEWMKSFTSLLFGSPLPAPVIYAALALFLILGVALAGLPLFKALRSDAERVRRNLELRSRSIHLACSALRERQRLRLAHEALSQWSATCGWGTRRGFFPLAEPGSTDVTVNTPRAMQIAVPVVDERQEEIEAALIEQLAQPGWRLDWLKRLVRCAFLPARGRSLQQYYADPGFRDGELAGLVSKLSLSTAQERATRDALKNAMSVLRDRALALEGLNVTLISRDGDRLSGQSRGFADWFSRLDAEGDFAKYLRIDASNAGVESEKNTVATGSRPGQIEPLGAVMTAMSRFDFETFQITLDSGDSDSSDEDHDHSDAGSR